MFKALYTCIKVIFINDSNEDWIIFPALIKKNFFSMFQDTKNKGCIYHNIHKDIQKDSWKSMRRQVCGEGGKIRLTIGWQFPQ